MIWIEHQRVLLTKTLYIFVYMFLDYNWKSILPTQQKWDLVIFYGILANKTQQILLVIRTKFPTTVATWKFSILILLKGTSELYLSKE